MRMSEAVADPHPDHLFHLKVFCRGMLREERGGGGGEAAAGFRKHVLKKRSDAQVVVVRLILQDVNENSPPGFYKPWRGDALHTGPAPARSQHFGGQV